MVLPIETFSYFHTKIGEAFEKYFNFKNFGFKPWETNGTGKVYQEDIRILQMMEIIMSDRNRYAKKKADNDAEMERTGRQLSEESRANAKGRRRAIR